MSNPPDDWNGYTDQETGYDADDYEDFGMGVMSDGADLNDDEALEEMGNPGASS